MAVAPIVNTAQQSNAPLNPSQQRAFLAAISNNQAQGVKTNHYIFLIKGPPGTGKTLVTWCIAWHCYKQKDEKVLITCGTNRGLDNIGDNIQSRFPEQNNQWAVPCSVAGVYRLETDNDESFDQLDRNTKAYQHSFKDHMEFDSTQSLPTDLRQALNERQISGESFSRVENYVKRRLMTNRPLSLGDHILCRLTKAKSEGSNWTNDRGNQSKSDTENKLLWNVIGFRRCAERNQMQYVDILGETTASAGQ